MSMTRTLYSVSALSTELAKDRRTISRALAAVPPDGQVGAHPGWHMLTALAALGWTGRKLDGERLDPDHERAQGSGHCRPARDEARHSAQGLLQGRAHHPLGHGRVLDCSDERVVYTEPLGVAR